ncbi:MAG TPA: hypothetical protein GX738_03300 [Firmicutes bacterium]|nr:hypothetical protein [Bacillota bacterium]
MSIRPIDPQSILHKASESQRVAAATRGQPNPEQHHFLQELQQQSAQKQQMVRQTDDAEANKLQADDRSKGRQQGQEQRRERRQKKPASKWELDRDRGTRIDIKV